MSLGRKINPEESLSRLQTKKTSFDELEFNDSSSVPKPDASGSSSFQPRLPKYTLSNIVLSNSVKTDFNTLISRIANHRTIYYDWGFSESDPQGKNIAVNFYGKPGTGKTMLSEALASELNKQIIEVNYAEIESKYVGETAKNIVSAFNEAKKTDSVLFFDEADSILGRRLTNVTQSADHGVNVSRSVMLKQIDDFAGVVVFATNLAKNFDSAFVRRILQHIHVLPPDLNGRLAIWEKMISIKVPGRPKLDFKSIAEYSDGLTGGQIKNAVLLALSSLASLSDPSSGLHTIDVIKCIDNVKTSERDVGDHSDEN